jgi:hypothetical protein
MFLEIKYCQVFASSDKVEKNSLTNTINKTHVINPKVA